MYRPGHSGTRIIIVRYHQSDALQGAAEHVASGARSVPGTFIDCLLIRDQPVGARRKVERGEHADLRCRILARRLSQADAVILGIPANDPRVVTIMHCLFDDCGLGSSAATSALAGKIGATFTEEDVNSQPGIDLLHALGIEVVDAGIDNLGLHERLGRRVAEAAHEAARVRAPLLYDPSA